MEGKEEPSADFFSLYLQYTAQTECPTFFHRWTAITSLAAWIGRDIHLPFGHFKVHANMYSMLVGLAGTKKSTAIKIGAKLLKEAGYAKFAAKKTRQEKFLIDLAEQSDPSLGEGLDAMSVDDMLDVNLFGDSSELKDPAECFVAADEINNFIGVGNLEFMSILGELWDIDEPYDYKLKNSKSVNIPDPTISILGGNTFVSLNRLFPPEAIEQGFFSRMLFIYSEPTGAKHTIPPAPDMELQAALISQLHQIKAKVQGKITFTDEAYQLLDTIYRSWEGIEDSRFDAYANRRDVHLLKLCLVHMAVRLDTVLRKEDVLQANTILTFTEQLMPKALGEFGKAKNSGTAHKIMQLLDATDKPLTSQDLWKHTHTDLERRDQLIEIINSLLLADKVQSVDGAFLPVRKVRSKGIEGTVDWKLLTESERGLIR